MLAMLRDLVQHKAYANAAVLAAVGQHPPAASDAELRNLLHHILLANRFWLTLFLGRPFVVEEESKVPESLSGIVSLYRDTHVLEAEWLAKIQESDLDRKVETPFIPGHGFSVAEGLIQVCMHSQGHRSQCSTRLRLLGGKPPSMDFILWLKDRPAPTWP